MSSSSNILNEPRGVEIAGKIMVAAVILLFMVAAFVLFLHLYSKCFLWRVDEETITFQPRVIRRHRRRGRRFVFAPGQDPIIYGSNHHQLGLDPTVLKSLPVLVFHPNEFKDGLECAVCLSEVVQGEKARILPKCNHGFHVDCIDMWFQSHSTCPLCRTLVTTYDQSTSSGAEQSDSLNFESSQTENSDDLSVLEYSNFPTHVLVWGDQTQFSSVGVSLEDENSEVPPSSTSNSSSASNCCIDGTSSDSRCNEMLVIDIPSEFNSSSLSSPSSSNDEDETMKPPMAARLRSLTRLLSREKKSLSPCNPNSVDVELENSKEFDDGGIH